MERSEEELHIDSLHLRLLMEKIDGVKGHLGDNLNAVEQRMKIRLDAQDKALNEIKEQTTKTNGRVSVLEDDKKHVGSVLWTFRWVPRVAGLFASTALTILVLVLTGSIHIS